MRSRSMPRASTSPTRARDVSRRTTRPTGLAEGGGGRRTAARSGLILAADTVCAVDGEILNKPLDRADAERMIRLQEGRDTRRDHRDLPVSGRSPRMGRRRRGQRRAVPAP